MESRTLKWLLIRHAPVTGQAGVLYGQNDVACDLSGQETPLTALAAQIPEGAAWYCTPLSRTHVTAQAIKPGVTPAPLPAFLEQNFGQWQGQRYDDLWQAPDQDDYRNFWDDPVHKVPAGGESYVQLRQRVAAGMAALMERHPSGTIVLVAHGGSIRCALEEALGSAPGLGLTFEIAPLSLTEITLRRDNTGQAHWLIDRVNQKL